MPPKFGEGSKPAPEDAMTEGKARRDQHRGEDLLWAVLLGLGLRDYFEAGTLDVDQRMRAAGVIVMESSASLTSTTRDLMGGKITVRVWYLRMRDILVSASLASAMAILGRREMTDEEIGAWVSEFNLQDGYLTRFRDQLKSGEQAFGDVAIGRADLYARALWSTSWRVLGAAIVAAARTGGIAAAKEALGDGASSLVSGLDAPPGEVPQGWKVQALRIRSLSDSCGDCVEWEALGWVDVESDDYHDIGTSICGARCKCYYIYRVVPA